MHLYLARPECLDDPLREAACRALLTHEERAKVDRYLRPEDQRLSLLARALTRNALSRFARVSPAQWRFVANRYGRPEIAHDALDAPDARGLAFNLSHTRGMVALVVARDREIGVDVEDTSRRGQTVEIAERFFAPAEVMALTALEEHHQRRRFFDHWTLKESYIKARGMGLSIPLQQFAFTVGDGDIRLTCDPALGDDGGSWRFEQRAPTAHHLVALAARCAPGETVAWVEHDGTELLP